MIFLFPRWDMLISWRVSRNCVFSKIFFRHFQLESGEVLFMDLDGRDFFFQMGGEKPPARMKQTLKKSKITVWKLKFASERKRICNIHPSTRPVTSAKWLEWLSPPFHLFFSFRVFKTHQIPPKRDGVGGTLHGFGCLILVILVDKGNEILPSYMGIL